jgi:hypothetical protein
MYHCSNDSPMLASSLHTLHTRRDFRLGLKMRAPTHRRDATTLTTSPTPTPTPTPTPDQTVTKTNQRNNRCSVLFRVHQFTADLSSIVPFSSQVALEFCQSTKVSKITPICYKYKQIHFSLWEAKKKNCWGK